MSLIIKREERQSDRDLERAPSQHRTSSCSQMLFRPLVIVPVSTSGNALPEWQKQARKSCGVEVTRDWIQPSWPASAPFPFFPTTPLFRVSMCGGARADGPVSKASGKRAFSCPLLEEIVPASTDSCTYFHPYYFLSHPQSFGRQPCRRRE